MRNIFEANESFTDSFRFRHRIFGSSFAFPLWVTILQFTTAVYFVGRSWQILTMTMLFYSFHCFQYICEYFDESGLENLWKWQRSSFKSHWINFQDIIRAVSLWAGVPRVILLQRQNLMLNWLSSLGVRFWVMFQFILFSFYYSAQLIII